MLCLLLVFCPVLSCPAAIALSATTFISPALCVNRVYFASVAIYTARGYSPFNNRNCSHCAEIYYQFCSQILVKTSLSIFVKLMSLTSGFDVFFVYHSTSWNSGAGPERKFEGRDFLKDDFNLKLTIFKY